MDGIIGIEWNSDWMSRNYSYERRNYAKNGSTG